MRQCGIPQVAICGVTAVTPMLDGMPPPDDLKSRPGELRAWLETFPAAGAFDLARAIIDYLSGVNTCQLALDERLGLLELASSRAHDVLRDLEGIYGTSPQPMETHAREALDLARKLSFALAGGYKIASLGRATDGIRVGAPTKLAPLVLTAMRYLGKAMRASYKGYARVPNGAWREMHE